METGRTSEPGALPVSSSVAKEGQSRRLENCVFNIGESAANCQLRHAEASLKLRVFSTIYAVGSRCAQVLGADLRESPQKPRSKRRPGVIFERGEATQVHRIASSRRLSSRRPKAGPVGSSQCEVLCRRSPSRTEYRRRSFPRRGRGVFRFPSARNDRNCRRSPARRAPRAPRSAPRRGCRAA